MSEFIHALLRDATHGVLLTWTDDGDPPRLVALASPAWWDGEGVWMVAGDAEDARLGRTPCAVVLGEGSRTVAVRGEARVFGVRDPVGLTLHGAAIAGAMTALALRGAGALRRALPGGLPATVALRVAVRAAEPLRFPEAGDGIAPALPADVPADVRRALAGVRAVAVLAQGQTAVHAACWGGGMVLTGAHVPDGRVAVVARASATGLALEGRLGADARFVPDRALWWRDGERGAAQVRSSVGAIVLPE